MVRWRSSISLIDLLRGLISRSNTGLARAKKGTLCNSSLVPRPNVMLTVAIVIPNLLEASSNGLYAFKPSGL